MEVKEKKVELMELFYDLIYVYAIANMTLLIEEPENGVISWGMFLSYIVSSMVIIQAWLYMTNYVNRYCEWRWYECVLMVLNMFAAMLMSRTITESWATASLPFLSSMMAMMGCIAVLYIIQFRANKPDAVYIKDTIEIISIILLVYVLALALNLWGYKQESLFIIAVNILLGIILPFVGNGVYDPKFVSFPHLVERLELLTIVTFGEAVVGVAAYFDLSDLDSLSVLSFLLIILMFGCYVCQVHRMCDHHQVVDSGRMVWSHYAVILTINMVTVALHYHHSGEADPLFTAALMASSLLAFFLSLFSTSKYYHGRYSWTWRDYAMVLVFLVIGSTVMTVFSGDGLALIGGSVIASGAVFIYLVVKRFGVIVES